jgi:hypothetical protein
MLSSNQAMFLRFVSADLDENSQVRLGIFQAAFDLRESESLPTYELDELWETNAD